MYCLKQMQLMLLTTTFFLLLLNEYTDAQAYYSTSAGGVGAVYTMSNGVPNNQILVHRLLANGKLSLVNAVNTGGTGSGTTLLDILESQASIKVQSNYLFVVNAGSNTLSMFVICPWDATQIKLLSVKRVFGWFPVSVTVNDKYACVVSGGNVTGFRCFTYNSYGLFVIPSFDRDLTSYVSQTVPPTPFLNTIHHILFSTDNQALIISLAAHNATSSGYLLFFLFNNQKTVLSTNPIQAMLPGSVGPFGMTYVGKDGLIIPDAGANRVITLKYSSSTGTISNTKFTNVNASDPIFLCWSAYSPTLGSYYVVGPGGQLMLELRVNLASTTTPVQIVQRYDLSNTGALEVIVVTLGGKDYLYVIGVQKHVINGFRLDAVGRATLYTVAVSQPGNTTNVPNLAGLAAYLQTRSSSNDYSRCRPAKSCFAKRDYYFDC